MSVPSIDSSSDVQLVCCSSGAGGADIDRWLPAPRTGYRSMTMSAAGA